MVYEVWHREEVRRGCRVEGRGYAGKRWHDESNHPRAFSWRGQHVREHHFELTHGQDRCFARDGGDRRGVHHDQRLEKPKVDIPYFDGGHPYDWLDRAKYFFRVYEVLRVARFGVASIHLEGTTRKWWRRLKSQFENKDRRLRWTAFEYAFLEQWGSLQVADPQG